jgi:hypothetical protein
MMNNIMIDLETLGSTPGCAILSIGLTEFDPETQELGAQFYANIDLQSCLDVGLFIESETFYWWLAQSQESKMALTFNRSVLDLALANLNYYFSPNTIVWSHGSSFDLAVLSAAYRAVGRKKPWAFRNERDTRTALDLAGMKMPKIPTAHQALEDAKSQAHTIMAALQKLKGL